MRDATIGSHEPAATNRVVDTWLRFTPALDARYEATAGVARYKDLRETIYIGLVLFNIHNLTNLFLIPDIAWIACGLRMVVVTPVALVLVGLLFKMPAALREYTALLIVGSAFLMEVVLFALTKAPLGPYSFNEFTLTLVFGNMMLALRFRHAAAFTALALVCSLLVVAAKPLLNDALRFAFTVQIAMACLMSLYANYRAERRRCDDFIVAHSATIQAGTDALTGLPNRRSLTERLDTWFREGCPAAIMIIDIDHFKLFNDALGHQAGDECLRQVGAVLADAAQNPDVFCARVGGEEFVLAICNADRYLVQRHGAGIVAAIAALDVAHPARPDAIAVVTASVGVALRPADDWRDQSGIFAAADHALYEAKRSGRNRCVFEALVETEDARAA